MKKLPKNLENFLYDETQKLTVSIVKSFLKYLEFHEEKSLGWCVTDAFHDYEDRLYHRFIDNINNNELNSKQIKEISVELGKIKKLMDNFGRDYDCM